MLAYVFWHWPQSTINPAAYVNHLIDFHQTLAANKPTGFHHSVVFRIRGASWLNTNDEAYEEWYLLDDSAAMDPLNEAAVSGVCEAPHNRVAREAADGIGGLYRLRVGGEGPVDLVLVPGWISHLEYQWEDPALARFLNRLASFSRLIVFDKRGTGLSDRVAESALPTLEQRMDDIRAVMDAVGSNRAAMFGISEGGPLSTLFAATYPARTAALIMYGTYAKWIRSDDYPWGPTREQHEAAFKAYEKHWGTPIGLKTLAPSAANEERVRQWWAHFMRIAASPGAGITLYRMNVEVDIRAILPTIRIPTLILHRSGDRLQPCEGARYMAGQIPAAKFVELPGDDHIPWIGNADPLLAEIQEFLTGETPVLEVDRFSQPSSSSTLSSRPSASRRLETRAGATWSTTIISKFARKSCVSAAA